MLAYLLVIAATLVWLVRRESRDPLLDKRDTRHPVRLFGRQLFRLAQHLRHLPLHHPVRDAGAASDHRRGGTFAAVPAQPLPGTGARFAPPVCWPPAAIFWNARPSKTPMSRRRCRPSPIPTSTMVVMTGDAPMGFIATTLPPQIPVLRIDGWMVQPRDGTAPDPADDAPGGGASGGGRRPLSDRRCRRHGPCARCAGRLPARHPLAGVPAIRYKPDRHLSMVPAGEEKLKAGKNRESRGTGALLQRGSGHRQGRGAISAPPCPDATIYVYDNNSKDQTVARARGGGRGGAQRSRARARAMWCAACSPISRPTSMCWWTATIPMTPAPSPRMIARMIADGADLLTARRIHTDAAAYRPGHVLGNRHADRPDRAAVQCASVGHAERLPRLFPPLRQKPFPSPPKASPSRPN